MAIDKIQIRNGFLWFFKGSSRRYLRDTIHSDDDWERAIRCWFSHEDLAAWAAYEAGYMDGYQIAREESE